MPQVLSAPVFVAGVADFIRLKEQHLGDAFVGVDFGRQVGGVGKFQGDLPFPLGFQWCDVDDDATPRVGGFAQADGQHAAGDTEVFHGARQGKGVGRDDADVAGVVDEAVVVEVLRVHGGGVNVGEDLEFVAATDIVAVAGCAVGDYAAFFGFAGLIVFKGFDHAVIPGHPANPVVGFDAHG